jgi:4-hydroxy-tetrahydrodipicolinate reductase
MGHSLIRLLKDLSAVGEIAEADVVIDFSHPDWTGPLVERLLAEPRALVVGTTGLSTAIRAQIVVLSQQVPVVLAPNTGTGVNVLRSIAQKAAEALGDGWDIEVLELHHRRKVDAPSGTAWMLLEALGNREDAVPSRVGETGARTNSEIGIQTLRGGDVVGEHTVYLIGEGERLELTHRAWSRDTFARGALRAARWLLKDDRTPGLYSMADVLDL